MYACDFGTVYQLLLFSADWVLLWAGMHQLQCHGTEWRSSHWTSKTCSSFSPPSLMRGYQVDNLPSAINNNPCRHETILIIWHHPSLLKHYDLHALCYSHPTVSGCCDVANSLSLIAGDSCYWETPRSSRRIPTSKVSWREGIGSHGSLPNLNSLIHFYVTATLKNFRVDSRKI